MLKVQVLVDHDGTVLGVFSEVDEAKQTAQDEVLKYDLRPCRWAADGRYPYKLNLIDTDGYVVFTMETHHVT